MERFILSAEKMTEDSVHSLELYQERIMSVGGIDLDVLSAGDRCGDRTLFVGGIENIG
jgi:hypothetical protein